MKKSIIIIVDEASYEAYLKDLFKLAVTTQGTQTKSIDEILLDKAVACGPTLEGDVKRILNVRGAVNVILKSTSEAQYKSTNLSDGDSLADRSNGGQPERRTEQVKTVPNKIITKKQRA